MIKFRQKFYKIFFAVIKNLSAFLAGSFLGILTMMLFARSLLERTITKDIGLGIIAIAPVLLLFYSIAFGVIGGVIAIIVYNLARFIKRKRKLS